MRFKILLLALVIHHCQLAYGHPPPQPQLSGYAADSPDDANDEGGYGAPLLLPQAQHANKQQQQPLKQQPATYITTSKVTSTSSTISSTASTSSAKTVSTAPAKKIAATTNPGTTAATGTPATSTTPMQPAFVYEAALPTHVEADKLSDVSGNSNSNTERDGESSKKIIGSSVVTSVSVILNGNEPEYTDALGHKVPKPLASLQVASPIDLLNPDRYEFYTFDDNGELVKRLMTMQEIQSIVANGDGDGPTIIHTAPIDERDPEKNVQDIVNSVQSVLNKEVESNKNNTQETLPVLDTPDVSSSWSLILPAIFGNTGGDIFPQQKPQQIVMTPDSDILETSTKKTPLRTTKKPKPQKRKPGQKRKTTTKAPTTATTEMTPQVVQEELEPHESVYTGMQQYQNIASNFDGFSQLQMQPIYHKLPQLVQHDKPETTTRRSFVNNQEIIEGSASTTTSTEKPFELSEHLAKKPGNLHHKHTPPHRNKTPNDGVSTTKRPQGGAHNKQKIKKKPATTTTTTTTTTTPVPTTTTPEPTTTSTTTEPTTTTTTTEPTTTTTTTEPTTTTTTTEPTTTTTTTTTTTPTTPAPTTTTTPAPITTTTPTPSASTTPKKKRKKPSRQPIHQGNGTRPHLTGEKRKPTHRPAGTNQRPHQKPTQQQQHQQYNKHRPVHDSVAEATSTVHQHNTTTTTTTHKRPVNHHKQRPRPHRPTTTTTVQTPLNEETLIVQEFPGYGMVPLNVMESSKSPAISTTTSTTTTTTTTPAPTTTTTTTVRYPMPFYDATQHEETHYPAITEEFDELNQLKKTPFPSLAMLQQHKHQQQQPKPQNEEDDLHTQQSFDQILQSLQQDHKPETAETKQPVKEEEPIQQPSLQSYNEAVEIKAERLEPSTTTTTTTTTTTPAAPLASYGDSTQSSILTPEVGLTGRPVVPTKATTEAALSTEKTSTSSEEDNTPVVVITARPQFFVTTKIPSIITTLTTEREDTATELSQYSTEFKELEVKATTAKPLEKTTEDPSHVIKFEPLYAELQDPIITELTTTTANYEVDDTTVTEVPALMDVQTEAIIAMDEHEQASYSDKLSRLPVTVPQKVESLIASGEHTTEQPPMVTDLKPHLNMEVLKPTDQITMSDFQTQAATVASTLVDGTNTMAADIFMSSNETKDELEFLMSDVIQQMTGLKDGYRPMKEDESANNRLTNYAQLNSSFLLMKPTQVASAHKQDASTHLPTYGQPSATTVAMDAITTESPKLKAPLQIATTTTTTTTTTESAPPLIPSKEELIKQEAAYLSTVAKQEDDVKSTTAPYTLVLHDELPETTTFKIPLLSLSQIYAQQQQEEAEKEALYEAEREKATTETVTQNTEQSAESSENETTEQYLSASAENEKVEQAPVSSDNKTDEVSEQSEETETKIAETVTEIEKIETTEAPYTALELKVTTPSVLSDESTEKLTDTTLNEKEDSTEQTQTDAKLDASAQDSTEQNYVAVLKPSTAKLEADVTPENDQETSNEPMKESLQDALKETSTEISNDETKETIKEVSQVSAKPEQDSSAQQNYDDNHEEADNTANSAYLQPQYSTEPFTDFKKSSEEIKTASEISTTVPYVDDSASSTEVNAAATTLILMDANSDVSAIETTENYETTTLRDEVKTDTYEETSEASDELIATVSDEDNSELSLEEDPYVKLGEVTSKPLEETKLTATEALKASIEGEDEDEDEEEHLTTVAVNELPEAIKPIEYAEPEPEDLMINGHQAMLPMLPEIADEEDDEDQTVYHVSPLVLPTSTTALKESSASSSSTSTTTTTTTTTSTPKPTTSTTKRLNTLKPVSYYKQPAFSANKQPEQPLKVITYTANNLQQRPMQRPASLNNLMASSTQATRPPVKLEPSPLHSKGLEASTADLDEDLQAFARLCNELAFSYWRSITSEKISSARSLVLSPFALTSMLSMVFLGARGGTSGEMNEVLKLDDMVTFNPHLVFKNVTESVERATDSDIATTAFVREIFSDRANGKILQFFKEKTQQFYAGHVEEVNFHVVNDVIRRRTNLLVKRHTMGKVLEYLRTNSLWVNGPLATISANLFQTDCSHGSTHERDGEMFFQVHPTVRQRRLVPVPAVLYKSGFTAGYEPGLDATIVAFGRIEDTVSTIYVMPGHQSSVAPTDNLDRLEQELVEQAFSQNGWSKLLTSLMDRPGMEVQLPRFSHRSFVNASLGLQKMGLKGLFKSDFADLRGLTGSSNHDVYLSDMIQINTFSTCGEEKISDHHHVEMYPAPPLRKRNKDMDAREDDDFDSSEAIIDFGSLVQDSALGRGFYDDLLDPKYLELPLPLRPRQARVPDAPRLRFDKPFLYFVRHNPTGMILFMGRFNPRLLP